MRLANRSRSETSRRRAADGSPPHMRLCTMQARDERAVCGMWSEGGGATPARKPRVGHGRQMHSLRGISCGFLTGVNFASN